MLGYEFLGVRDYKQAGNYLEKAKEDFSYKRAVQVLIDALGQSTK